MDFAWTRKATKSKHMFVGDCNDVKDLEWSLNRTTR